ncbi:MAG: heme NO-binding protein [Rhodobacter sp.]|nr:heme NO-binding protein [Rhodobacter sp.]
MPVRLCSETTMGSDMDALMLRSLQGYVRDTFGPQIWQAICCHAALSVETFEPMLRYDPGMADRVASHAADVLGRPVETVWEDMGTYLVTNPRHEGVRRLLRFGGSSFADFLHSLEEMPGRARLAMPDLVLPMVTLREIGPDQFEVQCQSRLKGMLRVLVGMLTAMADDYGTLCLIDPDAGDCISVRILDSFHGSGRRFDLALPEK